MMRIFAFVILFLASANEIAIAQQTPARYPTTTGNNFAPGSVLMYLNPSGQSVPTSATNPVPVTCISGCSGGGGGSVTQGTSPWVVSNGGTFPVQSSQNGVWTVTGSGGTFPVTGTFWQATQPVSGTFWQATQPISAVALPLPAGAMPSSGGSVGISGTLPAFASPPAMALNITPSLANGNGIVPTQSGNALSATNGTFVNVLQGNVVLSTGNPLFAQLTAGAAAIGSVTANAGSNLNTSALALDTSVGTANTNIGPPGTTACATDTGSCSINALEQRLAQRLTTINGTLGTLMQATGGTVQSVSGATGGATPFHALSAATNNSTNIKASAGTVYGVTIVQTTTTLGDFRFYDSASAPTCSSATGAVNNYAIQSNANSPGFHLTFPVGKKFVNGIGFCLTGAVADNDNTNFVTGVQINVDYN